MWSRVCAVVAGLALLAAAAAPAAARVDPAPNTRLTGMVQFPRPQEIWVQTNARATRIAVGLAFHGRCRGGRLAEVWGAKVPAREAVRVRRGAFAATLTGVIRDFGRVKGRTAEFRWRLRGQFVQPTLATATVSGTATVTRRGRVVARCRISPPAPVGLSVPPI